MDDRFRRVGKEIKKVGFPDMRRREDVMLL